MPKESRLTRDFEEVAEITLVVTPEDTAVFTVTVAVTDCVEVDVILGDETVTGTDDSADAPWALSAIGVFDIAESE